MAEETTQKRAPEKGWLKQNGLPTAVGVLAGVATTLLAQIVTVGVPAIGHLIEGPQRQFLAWHVDVRPIETPDCDSGYVIAGGTPENVSDPYDESWQRSMKAMSAVGAEFTIHLQGQTDQVVVLDRLDVVIDSRTDTNFEYRFAPTTGGCGGGLTPRYFDVDLGVKKPVAVPKEGGGGAAPTNFPYKVSTSDPEQFNVSAVIDANQDIRFHFEIPWHSGRDRGTLVLNDIGGRPYAAGGRFSTPVVTWEGDPGVWKET